MTPVAAAAAAGRMLNRLLSIHQHAAASTNQVRLYLISLYSLSSFKLHFLTRSRLKSNNTHFNSAPLGPKFFARSVLSRCFHSWDAKFDAFPSRKCSLKEFLLRVSVISPETCRKFLGVLSLKPEDVLEILLDCECQLGFGDFDVGVRGVESLWGIFKWFEREDEGFKHLPRSFEVMASLLVRIRRFKEVESLLSTVERRGILLANDRIWSDLIDGYVDAGDLDKALLLYDRMKKKCIVPSLGSYNAVLDLLMKESKTQLAFRVYVDLLEVGSELGDVEARNLERLIRLLCMDGKVKDARRLVKKTVALGLDPSDVVLNEIANAYCEKKDSEEFLSLFVEMKRPPDILVANKIIDYLCSTFGTERADLFLKELQHLGFTPNEKTLGILIARSCHDGKLRDAFIYFAEILSTGLKPDIISYNALISGIFMSSMWEHAREILDEMIDNGIKPNLMTFRALLAGYCNARKFDEVKQVINNMADYGLIELSPLDDPLSRAFVILGLNPLTVRVKRDNDIRYSRTEFFDDLGNGLYLDTNLDEFEKNVTSVLKDSITADFDLLVERECDVKNLKAALAVVDEMREWGQEPSLTVLSNLVRALCGSRGHVKAIPSVLSRMPNLFCQQSSETLNLVVQTLCKTELADKEWSIIYEMRRRNLPIKNETYTAAMLGLLEMANTRDILLCWDIVRKDKWSPSLKSCDIILARLCNARMIKEIFELFHTMLESHHNLRAEICDLFLEKLCTWGFTESAQVLVDKLVEHGCRLNRITYSHLINGYCREKRFSEALAIFDIMKGDNLTPSFDALELLIPVLCRDNRIENAIDLKDVGIKEYLSDSSSIYGALICGLCKTGNVVEAEKVFLEMLSKDLVPNHKIYNELIQAHCHADNLSKVREILGVTVRKRITISISSYRNLVHLLCKKGMVLSAMGLKRFMLVETGFSHLIMSNILIFYLFQSGNVPYVGAILDELKAKGQQPDDVTYNFLVYGFSRCKDVSKSMHYLNEMISVDLKPSNRSLRIAIGVLCSNGDIQKAMKLSKEMNLKGWTLSATTQYTVLNNLLSCGRILEAETLLDLTAKNESNSDRILYDTLIQKFCSHRKLETAINLLNSMLKQGTVPSAISYDSIIYSLCAHDKMDRALDFFNEMLARDLNPSTDTLEMLVHKFCQKEQTAEAERMLICMAKMGLTPSKEMYRSVIDRYRFEDKLSKASEIMSLMQKDGYEPDFETQWSLISNLSKESDTSNKGFLSKLLTCSGFSPRGIPKAKSR